MSRTVILSLLAVLLVLLLPHTNTTVTRLPAQTSLSPDARPEAPRGQPRAALENEEDEEDSEVHRDLPATCGIARPPAFRARQFARPVAAIRPPSWIQPTFGRAPPALS